MTVQQRIQEQLEARFDCHYLEVANESDQHNVPAGSESHFRIVIVSPDFSGETAIARHRSVYGVLTDEMAGPVHALALHAYTPDEWRQRQAQAPQSPPCQGGGRT